MDSLSIRSLEAYGPGALRYRHRGEVYALPHPADLSVDDILLALHAECLREMPPNMEIWRATALFRRWVAHHDLVDFNGAQRLAYLIDRYRDVLEYDLRRWLQVDLSDLWSSRRWRRLLNYIDHLPRESWYTEAVSNDEEHAAMIAKALADREDESESYHPPMRTWTQEASLLNDLLNAVRSLTHVTIVANGGKGATPPQPAPRPVTALERAQKQAEFDRKRRKHQSLVARMLPHKAEASD